MTTRVALPVAWALVLGSLTLLLTIKLAHRYRLGLAGLVVAWALWPGPASPVYWLGLAFQIPSLMGTLIAGVWFFSNLRHPADLLSASTVVAPTSLKILIGLGVVLGWVLLLDTLAWWPVSVYAWGFSPAVLVAVAVLTALVWGLWGGTGQSGAPVDWRSFAVVLVVLILFIVTRLPTGNLWDALLDPWLWGGLQVLGLARVLGRRQARRHWSAATRA